MSNFRKIAYGCIGWGTQPMKEIAIQLSKIGYNGIEGFGLTELLPEDRRLDRTLKDNELTFVGSYFGANLVQSDRANQEATKFAKTVAAVKALNGGVIAMGGGRVLPNLTKSAKTKNWKSLVQTTEKFGNLAKSAGIQLGFHPHSHSLVYSESEIDRLLQDTNPETVGLTLDTAHLASAGMDILDAHNKYKSRLVHIHLKDYDSKSGEFKPLGKGSLPLGAFLSQLLGGGYSGWLTVELDATNNAVRDAESSFKALQRMISQYYRAC